jgi:hypothetical protein
LLATGDEMARAAGFPGVHYVATLHRYRPGKQWLTRLGLGRIAGEFSLARLGFSSITTYVFLPDWFGEQVQSYPRQIDKRVREWPLIGRGHGLPVWPSVSPGWDARTRGAPRDPPPNAHPWAPVIYDESPAEFGRLLNEWKAFSKQNAGGIPILPVASWNEWTEGHAIAPCTRHGEGFVDVLRRFKASFGDTPPI